MIVILYICNVNHASVSSGIAWKKTSNFSPFLTTLECVTRVPFFVDVLNRLKISRFTIDLIF